MKLTIICDVGSNHRGRLDLALRAAQVAKDCGADVVKYQLFDHEALYGVPGVMEGLFQRDWLEPLAKECERVGIEFMCSAFSPEGVDIIDPYVKRHKLASSEFSDTSLIDAMLKTGKPMIASTGGVGAPDIDWFFDYVVNCGHQQVIPVLLECVAKYPANPASYDVNTIKGLMCGLSDHTIGSAVACAAVGAGATIIEKHFDPFSGEGSTPDSAFSANPTEFRMYVQDVREAASAVGDGIKRRKDQHEYALRWMRRYIVTKPIEAGDAFRYGENFGIYRSLKDDTRGLSPITMPLERLNGMSANCALQPGESIGPEEIQML